MEKQLKETREYSEHKFLGAVEKMLELRKEFVDKQADLFETEAANRQLDDPLRSEVNILQSASEIDDSLKAKLTALKQTGLAYLMVIACCRPYTRRKMLPLLARQPG